MPALHHLIGQEMSFLRPVAWVTRSGIEAEVIE